MDDFFARTLVLFSSLIGISTVPAATSSWTISGNGWTQDGTVYRLSAQSDSIANDCQAQPDSKIVFPQIILGVQKLVANGTTIYSTGDDSFREASPFYDRGSVSCRLIPAGSLVTWTATSSTVYFARFADFPHLSKHAAVDLMMDVGINVVAAGALLTLFLFSLFIFHGKVPISQYLPVSIGALSWAIYAVMISARYFGLDISTLAAQKIGEFFVCFGATFYFSFFRHLNYLSAREFLIYNISMVIGCAVIISGGNSDTVQAGLTIGVPAALLCFAMIMIRATQALKANAANRYTYLGIGSVASFVVVGANDLFHIIGLTPGYMILPIGAVSGVFFLAISVNREIEKTYEERDGLLHELEAKVAEKTADLRQTLETLQKSQADLVQSARLASLGTLSAGIAHEINNSINFVNGAIIPLERKVMKYVTDADQAIITKLFAAIKEGTSLTVEIVQSLRSFTGMNQAKVAEVKLHDVVRSVLMILRNRTKNIKVTSTIGPEAKFVGHQIGVNQILMNLISNACDAVGATSGEITVSAITTDDAVQLIVKDNGCGMTPEVAARVFEPFFTTKDVGKGTGLGLHIVRSEVDRHKGSIAIESAPEQGTSIKITFPKNPQLLFKNEMAA